MDAPKLTALDLNLLVALDALLATESVTGAARRTGVGQSAMSHSLARLRDVLGDPVLVRVGRRMVPTPRAAALRGPLTRVLAEIERVLAHEAAFDPTTSERTFRLICPDVLAAVLPTLLARLGALAPAVKLRIRAPDAGGSAAPLLAGQADLALGGHPPDVAGLRRRRLGEVTWRSVVRRDHPLTTRAPLNLRDWLGFEHIVVETGVPEKNLVASALAAAGISRRVGLTVPSFMSGVLVAARTDFVITTPWPLLAPLLADNGLTDLTPPLSLPAVPVSALWPAQLQEDPGHRWFRATVFAFLAGELGG